MGISRSSLKAWWWPDIPDRETACKIGRQTFAAAILLLVVAVAFAALAALRTTFAGLGPAVFVAAAAILGVIAAGLWRMSRIAAVAGLTLFVFDPIWMLQFARSAADFVDALLLTVLFSLSFINGVRATFVYHRHSRSGANIG